MHIALGIALVLALALVALVMHASTKPDALHVERSISMLAAPETIFAYLNDFHRWKDWTPYNKDPAMQKTYSGSPTGIGAHYAWAGNKNVGQGEITIRETLPPHKVVLDLHMIKPFEGRNVATFTLSPDGNATRVTWSLDDKHKLLQKIMSTFLNLDKMIGKDFEVGLAQLKAVVERQGNAQA